MSLRRDNEFHSFVVRPATSTATAPGSGGAVEAPASTGWTLLAVAVVSWLRAQRPLWWWRVLVLGAALLGLAWLAIVPDKLTALVPFYALAFAALLPAVTIVAWWEQAGKRTELDWDLPLALLFGLVAGVVSAFALYSGWLKLNIITWQGALLLAACEELLKTLTVIYFLWSARARGAREGLRIGLAAALGFTVTQMALASYLAYHTTVSAVPHAEAILFRSGIANMDAMLAFQLALQALGEAVWTATICAAIWRERGGRRFHLTPGLAAVVVAVLALHAAFNYVFVNKWLQLRLGGAYLPLVNLLLAGIGLLLLRFFIVETREHEALGSLPPSPLLPALGAYLGERRGLLLRWNADVVAAARKREATGQQTTNVPAPTPKGERATSRKPEPLDPPDTRPPVNTEWLK
jgi:hypothetical protein